MDTSLLKDVASEMMLIGCLYKNVDLFVQNSDTIVPDYDFSDSATRFYYNELSVMLKTFGSNTNEDQVNAYMFNDQDRAKEYKINGGYSYIKQCMELAELDDFDKYYDNVKKYALIREYDSCGYSIDKIVNWVNFKLLSAEEVYKLVAGQADKVFTNVVKNKKASIINDGMSNILHKLALIPQMGLEIPFPTLNNVFRGMRLGKMLSVGMLSNTGKTRLMCLLVSFIALVKNEKVLVMCNETDEEDIRTAILVSIINDKKFRALHGIDINKKEEEIVMGIYYDDNGVLIERQYDYEWGEYLETEEDYIKRLRETSTEYRQVEKVAKWIEGKINNTIYFKELTDYSDSAILTEIKRYQMIHGVNYFFYDTLKPYQVEQWEVLKQTATKLKETATKLNVFIYASIQLTDDALFVDVMQLSSNNIASSKHVKHVLDYLIFCKRLDKSEYGKYKYISNNQEWGSKTFDLDKNKTYYGIKIEKNRSGSTNLCPLLEVDLDKNTWSEIGVLVKSS